MDQEKKRQIAEKLHLSKLKYHMFLCADQTDAKCAPKEEGLKVWEYFKNRLDDLGLSKEGGVFRTKANCLRVCMKGPIMVVYPEGIWYHSVSIPVVEKIIKEHIIDGNPVREYIINQEILG
jgi:(2Fe-2S) ferredoxin